MGISDSIRSFGGKLGLITCSLLFFSSCVTEKDFLYLNDQIVALNKRMDSLQQATDRKLSSELDSRLTSIRERQAKADVENDKIREEMQKISGRLDENNQLVKRAIERDTTAQDDMRATVTGLEGSISELETRVKRVNAYLGIDPGAAQQGQDPKKEPIKEAIAAQEPVSQPQIPKEPEVSPEQRLYDVNLTFYREEKHEEAIAGFKNFLEKYPKSTLADNAQYWVGESCMALKQYEQAILAFQRVIKNYPDGNKVPNAILRQALAFYEIKDKTSARLLLKKLIQKYPKSSEANIAKAKLQTMK